MPSPYHTEEKRKEQKESSKPTTDTTDTASPNQTFIHLVPRISLRYANRVAKAGMSVVKDGQAEKVDQ